MCDGSARGARGVRRGGPRWLRSSRSPAGWLSRRAAIADVHGWRCCAFQSLGDTEPYFSEGVADELISELSRVRGMEVSGALVELRAHRATTRRQRRPRVKLGRDTGAHRLGAAIADNTCTSTPNWSKRPAVAASGARSSNAPRNEASPCNATSPCAWRKHADARITAPPPQQRRCRGLPALSAGPRTAIGRGDHGLGARCAISTRNAVKRDPNFARSLGGARRADANVASEAIDAGPADALPHRRGYGAGSRRRRSRHRPRQRLWPIRFLSVR